MWVPPPCASRKGVKRLQLWQFFSVDDPNTISSEPSAKHHLNGVMAFRWRVEHGPTLNAL